MTVHGITEMLPIVKPKKPVYGQPCSHAQHEHVQCAVILHTAQGGFCVAWRSLRRAFQLRPPEISSDHL